MIVTTKRPLSFVELTNELRVAYSELCYLLLFIVKVTGQFLHTSYELFLIARVTS